VVLIRFVLLGVIHFVLSYYGGRVSVVATATGLEFYIDRLLVVVIKGIKSSSAMESGVEVCIELSELFEFTCCAVGVVIFECRHLYFAVDLIWTGRNALQFVVGDKEFRSVVLLSLAIYDFCFHIRFH